jgi:hypothetical protein
MGRFMMMSDRRRLSRMVRRRDQALTPSCEVERGASVLRRLAPHVGGIRSAERALGEGPKAAFMSVRLSSIRKFSVVPVHCRGAARLQLIAANPPSGPALPGPGGVYSFLPNLSPKALAEDRADHVFLMVDMGCAHAGTVNRARGLRPFSKRQVRV